MQDRSWEQYGKEDPYFGVCTDPKYKKENLNEEALHDFFKTGEAHIEDVLGKIKSYFPLADINSFKQVLDFGCGTGRLLIPLAHRFQNVIGVDISAGMLAEAEKNLQQRNLHNVTLIQSEDINQIIFSESFNFIHTYIVLQHIPVEAGYPIIDKLIASVRKEGCGMIHFTYANHLSSFRNKKYRMKAKYKWFHQFSNLLKGIHPNSPLMQMNNYDLKKVFEILKQHKLKQIGLDFTDHGGFLGLCVYFHK